MIILLNVESLSKLSLLKNIEEGTLSQYDAHKIVEQQKEHVIKLKKSLSMSERDPSSPLRKSI